MNQPHACYPQCRDFGCQDESNPDCAMRGLSTEQQMWGHPPSEIPNIPAQPGDEAAKYERAARVLFDLENERLAKKYGPQHILWEHLTDEGTQRWIDRAKRVLEAAQPGWGDKNEHNRCLCHEFCGDVPECDDPLGICKGLRHAPEPPLLEFYVTHRDDPQPGEL